MIHRVSWLRQSEKAYEMLTIKRGFSLIELIVVIGIMAILTGLIFSMMDVANLGWDTQSVQMELAQETRRGLEAIVSDLYQTGSTQLNLDPEGDGSYDSIIYKLPAIIAPDTDIYDDTGHVRWGASGVETFWFRFRVDNVTRQLIKDVVDAGFVSQAGTARVCANNVEALTFLPNTLPPNNVVVTIVCQKPLRPGAARELTSSLDTRVTFRN